MPLTSSAEKKLLKIPMATNLPGFYQFNNQEDAIYIINKFEHYINDDGTFQSMIRYAEGDPNYQQLSAAIDYYKFNISRKTNPYIKN